MSRRVESGPIHVTHGETVERGYERCRQEGIPPEAARKIAEEAATRNHRKWDRESVPRKD